MKFFLKKIEEFDKIVKVNNSLSTLMANFSKISIYIYLNFKFLQN